MHKETDYVFVMYSLKVGGGNKLFINIANELARSAEKNVSIYYLFSSPKDKSLIDNVSKNISIVQCYSRFGHFFSFLVLIRKLKILGKLFIVSDPIIISFLAFFNLKYIRFIQEDDYHLYDGHLKFNILMLIIYKILQRISYKKKKIFYLVNSNFVRKCIIERPYNIIKKYIYSTNIHPALINDYFNIPITRATSLNCTIGTVGREQGRKGFKYFIELKDKLLIEEKKCEFKVLTSDDLSKFDIKNLSILKAKNDNECINFYDQCDIFVSTSLFEGFGMPALEAMARGCACVLFDCEGFKEFAVDNKNAIIVPTGDHKTLFDAVVNLINNIELREKLGREGIKTAKKFNWKYTALDFEHAINLNKRGIFNESI